MKREHLAFLLGGLAFGILIGFGAYHAVQNVPLAGGDTAGAAPQPGGPMGPPAPTQLGPNADGGAPMVAEVNRLKRVLQSSPDDVGTLLRLANLYYDAAMWEQAAGYYERVVNLDGGDPDVLTDLGVCYRGMRQFDRALEKFDEAHRLNERHWQSLYNTIVVAVFDVDRIDLAMQALESMEAIDPRPPELAGGRLDELRQILSRSQQDASEDS